MAATVVPDLTSIGAGSAAMRVSKSGAVTAYRATANTNAARGTALTAAVAALVSYDELVIGPGIFATTGPLDCSLNGATNLTIRGSGKENTTISCTPESGGGAALFPAANSTISDMTIESLAGDIEIPALGVYGMTQEGSGTLGTATWHNLNVIGNTLGMKISAGSVVRIFDIDVDSHGTTIVNLGTLKLYSVVVTTDDAAAGNAIGIDNQSGGNTYSFGSWIITNSATGNATGIKGNCNVYSTELSTGGVGISLDIDNSGGGTVTVDSATDYLRTSGTITRLRQYGVAAPATTAVLTISSSSTTPDAVAADHFRLTLVHTGATTINAPLNPIDARIIHFELIQDASGSCVVTWNAAFVFGTTGSPTLTTTASKRDIVAFQYSSSLVKWLYLGSLLGF